MCFLLFLIILTKHTIKRCKIFQSLTLFVLIGNILLLLLLLVTDTLNLFLRLFYPILSFYFIMANKREVAKRAQNLLNLAPIDHLNYFLSSIVI